MRDRNEISDFGRELNGLCDQRWPGGSKNANTEIAEWVSARTGKDVDRQFIWRIRKGRVLKVEGDVRDAIRSFFGVPRNHFARDRDQSLGDEVESVIEQTQVELAGLRAAELSPAGRSELVRLLRHVSELFEAEKGGRG